MIRTLVDVGSLLVQASTERLVRVRLNAERLPDREDLCGRSLARLLKAQERAQAVRTLNKNGRSSPYLARTLSPSNASGLCAMYSLSVTDGVGSVALIMADGQEGCVPIHSCAQSDNDTRQ